jgi:hypothetical protein
LAANGFDGVLHGERVHHRGEHAHVIGAGALHALRRALHAAENVSTADDKTHFGSGVHRVDNFTRHAFAGRLVDAVLALAHQRFAGDFQQHALIGARRGARLLFGEAHEAESID